MKPPSACTAALLAFCFATASLAADQPGAGGEKNRNITPEKSAGVNSYVLKARPKPADSTSTSTAATSEVFQDVVIPAGKHVVIQSARDYSSASTVAVSILCTACDSANTSMSTLGLVLEARWQAVNATTDIATQSASNFAFWDAGGAVFNVYAEQFNLELQNKGTTAIPLDQVTIFCPAR